MGKIYDEITPELREWIAGQKMFFVATAPVGREGHINLSPKGLDSFRVLGPTTVGYLDLTGSGAETIAHLRENGRICLMFCGFEGPPQIVRLHGRGEVITPDDDRWAALSPAFPSQGSTRSIILIEASRISDSCGFGVPKYTFAGERETLAMWAEQKGKEAVIAYQQKHNRHSIDGLPALEAKP